MMALDTLRADHLGCYGYARETSPNMDRLAREGILFENAITNTAHTGPTFTTLYSGQYAFTHDIVMTMWGHPDDPDQHFSDKTPTLAECLRRAGYLTAAFDNLMIWPSHQSHWARGYDYYVHTLNPQHEFCAAVLAEQINARLLPWIAAYAAKQPFFLFVHYWDPHQPYNQPEPYRTWHSGKPGHPEAKAADGRAYIPRWGWRDQLAPQQQEKIDLYDGEITYNDKHVGDVLEALKKAGVYDQTAIILTSDHGEDMREHNSPFEHREPYDATVRVPLIVKPSVDWPTAAPARVPAMVGHIDMMPAILELAGGKTTAAMDGKSWLGMLRNPDQTFHDLLYVTGGALRQCGRWRVPELAVRTEKRKYIRRVRVWKEPTHKPFDIIGLTQPSWRDDKDHPWDGRIEYFNALPSEELYDLAADPCEASNIAAANPGIVRDMRTALEQHVATNPARA